jgi:hypothetical protein
VPPIYELSLCNAARNKSLFASFSSEKEDLLSLPAEKPAIDRVSNRRPKVRPPARGTMRGAASLIDRRSRPLLQ